MTQMRDLAKPFASHLIQEPTQGKYGRFASHDVYEQKMIAVLGTPPKTKILREIMSPDGTVIEGCVMRMTVKIDGKKVSVEEPGDCEQPGNWKTQGQRLKDASSDAYKRCCMRFSVGLHLWADVYFLYDYLTKLEGEPQLPLDAPREYDPDDPSRPFEGVPLGYTAPPPQVEELPLGQDSPV